MSGELIWVRGTVVPGHRVASGGAKPDRFPGGTLALQQPVFSRLGVDISGFHRGTINVDVSPRVVTPVAPRHHLPLVEWMPGYPAESFSFAEAALEWRGRRYEALLYYPHPETKPEHHQSPHVVELLAPFVDGLTEGDRLELGLAADQVAVT